MTRNFHPMITHNKNYVHKSKLISDYHVRYPFPKALMATFQSNDLEPSCHSKAVKHPY
jgi:hypothetical protein